jgi:poly(hydroxyalkanoate) depolymerase family esterase
MSEHLFREEGTRICLPKRQPHRRNYTMNDRLKLTVLEATRLTREGRLDEAMGLLRGVHPFRPSADKVARSPDPRTRPTIPGITARTQPAGEFAQLASPASLRRFVDRISQPGLPGTAMPRARQPVPLPEGATFTEHVFTGEAGSRAYKLYVPSRHRGEALPLVVMLHGCTQTPDDFAAGTGMNDLAEEQMFLVAYPAQSVSANSSKCWNWFKGADQKRESGEPSLIAGITRQIMTDYPVAPGRIYIAGLSAGGAAAAIMGATYPDLFAAVGVHSGLACGAATDMPSAFTAMRQGGSAIVRRGAEGEIIVPTIVFHGDRDSTVHPVNGDRVIEQAKAGTELQESVHRGTSSAGMAYTRTVQKDDRGRAILEQWTLHGVAHAWSGGSSAGSYTEPRGPDASREMVRFFLEASEASTITLP